MIKSNNTLIISMTTWPPRINTAIITIQKLIDLIVINNYDCHLVLVLSLDEFNSIDDLPNTYKLLVDANVLEIIFDEGNIKAHKKLIPTLLKYPDNPILVVDDDKIYDNNLFAGFMYSHQEYPNDIIVGVVHFDLYTKDGKIISKQCNINLDIIAKTPNEIITHSKPASGLAGTLYPPHTFTMPEFFDRKLIRELCLESDEDWQYMFNILEDRQLRMCSILKNYYDNNGYDRNVGLYARFGQRYYNDVYYPKMIERFPEFYNKLSKRVEEDKHK